MRRPAKNNGQLLTHGRQATHITRNFIKEVFTVVTYLRYYFGVFEGAAMLAGVLKETESKMRLFLRYRYIPDFMVLIQIEQIARDAGYETTGLVSKQLKKRQGYERELVSRIFREKGVSSLPSRFALNAWLASSAMAGVVRKWKGASADLYSDSTTPSEEE